MIRKFTLHLKYRLLAKHLFSFGVLNELVKKCDKRHPRKCTHKHTHPHEMNRFRKSFDNVYPFVYLCVFLSVHCEMFIRLWILFLLTCVFVCVCFLFCVRNFVVDKTPVPTTCWAHSRYTKFSLQFQANHTCTLHTIRENYHLLAMNINDYKPLPLTHTHAHTYIFYFCLFIYSFSVLWYLSSLLLYVRVSSGLVSTRASIFVPHRQQLTVPESLFRLSPFSSNNTNTNANMWLRHIHIYWFLSVRRAFSLIRCTCA